jgi:peptidoglycan hydrolase CwlO-like protein
MGETLPKWASAILLSIIAFMLVMFIGDLRAQDSQAAKQIGECKETTTQLSKEIAVMQRDVQYEVRGLNSRMDSLSATVDSNAAKIDRMHALIEKMALKEGIK